MTSESAAYVVEFVVPITLRKFTTFQHRLMSTVRGSMSATESTPKHNETLNSFSLKDEASFDKQLTHKYSVIKSNQTISVYLIVRKNWTFRLLNDIIMKLKQQIFFKRLLVCSFLWHRLFNFNEFNIRIISIKVDVNI